MINKIVQRSAWLLGVVAAVGVAALMITVIVDTAGRFLFSSPIPGANDYIRYWWMILIVFGALGLAETRKEHIEALVFENKLTPSLKIVWRYIRVSVITITLTLLLIAVVPDANRNQMKGEYAAGSEITIWPTRYILAIGVTMFLVIAIVKVFEDRREILKGTPELESPEK